MTRRLSFFSTIFIILVVLNLFATIKFLNRAKKQNDISQILNEIDEVGPGQQFSYSNAPFTTTTYNAEVTTSDGRASNLKNFFRKYNSPLYDHADYIVEVSDKYKFDYRLLPAIAMQESGLCRAIPSGSHNCWGWGIYGNTVTRFDSYPEAIETVGRGLRRNYMDKGLVTASQIMSRYTPSSNGSWASGVNSILKLLD